MEHRLITYFDSKELMRVLGCFDTRALRSTLNGPGFVSSESFVWAGIKAHLNSGADQ